MSIELRTLRAIALATCLAATAAAQTTQTTQTTPPRRPRRPRAPSPATATYAEPSTAWHLYGGFGFGAADGKYGDVLQKPVQWEVRIAKQSASGKWRFGVGLQFGSMDPAEDPNIPPETEALWLAPDKEWARLETSLSVTRVFNPHGKLPPLSPGPRGDRAHPPPE